MGIGRTVLDVTGRMLCNERHRRTVASVFATLEALSLAGTAIGSLLVQLLVFASGVGRTLRARMHAWLVAARDGS